MTNKKSGLFITLEGGEGSGKTTYARFLEAFFKENDQRAIATREPGGTRIAEEIRALLLREKLSDLSELFLIMAARKDHVRELIFPKLESGVFVVCDRFSDSTRAYQEGAVDNEMLESLIKLSASGLIPDLIFILDIDPRIGLERVRQRRAASQEELTVFEERSLEYHDRVRERFLSIARKNPVRYCVIEAAQSREAIQEAMLRECAARFPDREVFNRA